MKTNPIQAAVDRYRGKIPNWDTFNEVIHGDFFKRYLGDDIWNRVIDRMREIDPDVGIVFNDYQLLTDDYGQEWSINYIILSQSHDS